MDTIVSDDWIKGFNEGIEFMLNRIKKANLTPNSQEKKDVGTLSNPLSGDTKQGGIKSQDDIKLQNERSASLPADNHPDTIQSKHKAEINDSSEIKQLLHKDYDKKGCGEIFIHDKNRWKCGEV